VGRGTTQRHRRSKGHLNDAEHQDLSVYLLYLSKLSIIRKTICTSRAATAKMPNIITLCKFVGTISLGLLTVPLLLHHHHLTLN
jgi:hypothetical protein